MSDYKFGSMLYDTRADMLAAIAYDWASSGSYDSAVRESLAHFTDAELARDCIEAWELDQDIDCGSYDAAGELALDPSHMAHHGYTEVDLAEAFTDLRTRIARVEHWWEFRAYNSEARYGYGDEQDAEAYCDHLNLGRDINVYAPAALTDANAEMLRLDQRSDTISLGDELHAIARHKR